MDKYVFLKVLENQEQVMIDPEYVLLIFTLCHIKKNQPIRIEENHCIIAVLHQTCPSFAAAAP